MYTFIYVCNHVICNHIYYVHLALVRFELNIVCVVDHL